MMTWTDERVSELKRLWRDGLSASQIGVAIGVTRNVVMGKIQRLQTAGEVERRRDPQAGSTPLKVRPKRHPNTLRKPKVRDASRVKFGRARGQRTHAVKPPTFAREQPAPPRARRLPLLALRPTTCRWPLWEDGEPKLFCGAACDPTSSYCEHHTWQATSREYRRRFERVAGA